MEERIEHLTEDSTEFNRELGVFGGISIIGGIMIGSGIFYLGSYCLQRAGMSYGLALLSWVIGGIVSLLGGLCYAELGVSFPRAGGSMLYLTEAFHPILGFCRGFSDWVIGGPASIAAMSIALPTAMKTFIGFSEMEINLIAAGIIIFLTIYNSFGIKQGALLQNVSMVAKLIPILIILVAALCLGKQHPDLSLRPITMPGAGIGEMIKMIALATVASLWAYEGWGNLNTMTEEMKEPQKNLPRALFLGIGAITLLYTLFNYSVYRVLTFEQVQEHINAGDLYLGTAAAKQVLGSAGGVIVSVGMILAIFGGLNGLIIAQPRMYYAMAVEGHFFRAFAKLHPKYKVPTNALVVQMCWSLILVFTRNLDQLTSLVVFTSMIFNFMTIIAVTVLRKKYPDLHRPYQIGLYPISVIVTAILFFGLVINTLFDDPVNAVLGLGVLIPGSLCYLFFDQRNKKERRS